MRKRNTWTAVFPSTRQLTSRMAGAVDPSAERQAVRMDGLERRVSGAGSVGEAARRDEVRAEEGAKEPRGGPRRDKEGCGPLASLEPEVPAVMRWRGTWT